MSRWTGTRGRAVTPWGLIGALGLVVLAETWVHCHAFELTNVGATGFLEAVRSSLSAREFEVLCLGDSLVKHGVAPAVVEGRLGRRTINLAAVGGIAPLTYTVLKRSLDGGARPKAVVLDFVSTQLQSDPRQVDRALAEAYSLGEILDLARSERDAVHFARLAASRVLPSLRARDEARQWIVGALRGEDTSQTLANRLSLRNWRVNRGAGLLTKVPADLVLPLDAAERFATAPGPWFCHPVNATYLKRCLDLTAARRVPVYWVLPPLHPGYQRGRDREKLDVNFERLVRRALERYPHLTVIDARRSGYPATVFADNAHLDVDGANTFSFDLAETLADLCARGSAAPRWVELRAYRPRPVPDGLEDFARSLAVVRGESAHALARSGRPAEDLAPVQRR
jgi:hypothetical protein